MRTKYLGVNLIILSLFILDRILKNIFLLKNPVYQGSILSFTLTKNPQILFGYLAPNFIAYILIILILAFLIYRLLAAYRLNHFWSITAYTLVIVGGFSNIWDRIRFNSVIDYFYLKNWSFFNLADIMIWLGIIIIIALTFQHKKIIDQKTK